MRWYAQSHASGCGRCGRFLANVTALLGQLKGIRAQDWPTPPEEQLSNDRWDSIEAGWAEVEK
jgi:hypothetical protein